MTKAKAVVFDQLESVEEINLKEKACSKAESLVLKGMNSLKKITFAGSQFEKVEKLRFEDFPNLSEIYLGESVLSRTDVTIDVPSLERLTLLGINGLVTVKNAKLINDTKQIRIGSSNRGELELDNLVNLTNIILNNEEWKYLSLLVLKNLPSLQSMEVHDDSLNYLYGFQVENCPNLREISTSGKGEMIRNQAMEISNIPSLEILHLGSSSFMSKNSFKISSECFVLTISKNKYCYKERCLSLSFFLLHSSSFFLLLLFS